MLLEAREAHAGSMAVGDVQFRSHDVPINLVDSISFWVRRGRMMSNRFVVELFHDCIEKSGSGAVRGHNSASSEARHLVGCYGDEKMCMDEQCQ